MKHTKVIALVLAALMFCMVLIPSVHAESDYYAEQVRKYEEMKNRTIGVGIMNHGLIVLKSSILYGREVTGVAEDGSFILGPWTVLDRRSGMPMGGEFTEVRGTYINFAYSVDILGGTDWPFSRIFWTRLDEPVTHVSCTTSGTARMVDIDLVINQRTVYSETNCNSHSEWKP